MAKVPNPFSKPKTFSIPKPSWETGEAGKAQEQAGQLLQKFGEKSPPAAKKAPTPTPKGGYRGGMSEPQYGGEGKDYAAMKPKLATKDKVLNPIKKAVGLPGKPMKMVPKKPGQK